MRKPLFYLSALLILLTLSCSDFANKQKLTINEDGYFEMPGLNVFAYSNTYLDGHQGGVEIIQHGNRVATCGSLTLSPSPGQWQPIPLQGGFEKIGLSPNKNAKTNRDINRDENSIAINCAYPDLSLKDKGFNPIVYPDLELKYNVKVTASGSSFIISVDLEEALPEDWVGEVGFNIEFFPGDLYGRTFSMDDKTGIFPQQASGPVYLNKKNEAEVVPLAEGKKFVVAPESDLQRISFESKGANLMLLDGSLKHNNGWFVVRSLVPANATKDAIQWIVTPNVIPNWVDPAVVHVSQIGYHPKQNKVAYIELDKNDKSIEQISLQRIDADGIKKVIKKQKPESWGKFARYNYFTFDFSEVTEDGMYCIKYGDTFTSNPFRIDAEVYKRGVWQPTLEYFLPEQMCHMRVNQKYRVWHGECHHDDALMAPENLAHFDGYNNTKEASTLTKFKALDHVPGLNVGGWHDAGDYDLRIETQAQTVIALALTYEELGIEYDATMVDQKNRHVEIHHPDGKADLLQQVEHGVLTILAGYHQFGMLYRGIIVPSLRQYVHLGDGATHTDNKVFNNPKQKAAAAKIDGLWYKKVANRYSNTFDPELNLDMVEVYAPELDDRLVFTETNPRRQLQGAAALAAASRVLVDYDPKLSKECIRVAEALYSDNKDAEGNSSQKIQTLSELVLTTQKDIYKNELIALSPTLQKSFSSVGWTIGRTLSLINDKKFEDQVRAAAISYRGQLDSIMNSTPFGVPVKTPDFLGFKQYFYVQAWPDIYDMDCLFNVLNYNLGSKPGRYTGSSVSGIGVESPIIAYGPNRADRSYVPGGTFWSKVNFISPDFYEDKEWPFFWQEREYIMTNSCYYMFSVLAADLFLNMN
jgi:endoglucanase